MLRLLQGSYDALPSFQENVRCKQHPPFFLHLCFQHKKDGKMLSSRICEEKLLGLDSFFLKGTSLPPDLSCHSVGLTFAYLVRCLREKVCIPWVLPKHCVVYRGS